jgi:hypothetical protein
LAARTNRGQKRPSLRRTGLDLDFGQATREAVGYLSGVPRYRYENGRAHAGAVANRGRADDLMVLLLAGRPNESRLEFDDHVAEGLHAQYLVDR